MKTTLEIPEPLSKKVKAKAAMEGLKMENLVAPALTSHLAGPVTKHKSKPKACPFPLVRGRGGSLLKRMNNQTIATLEEQENLERCSRSFGR